MKTTIKNVGLGLILLGMASIAGVSAAQNFGNNCTSGSIVSVSDTQSCNTQALSYANTASVNRVSANLVRINAATGFGIENRGVDSARREIAGCIAGVNGGGSNTDNTCGNLVANHKFVIRR
jgi:hypothetical protein